MRSWTFHLAELAAVGLKLLLFNTKMDEYTGTGGEVGVDLDNPVGTDSEPAATEGGVDPDNHVEAGSVKSLLVASQFPVPLSKSRTWCPFLRTWYLDPVPSSVALKNRSFSDSSEMSRYPCSSDRVSSSPCPSF